MRKLLLAGAAFLALSGAGNAAGVVVSDLGNDPNAGISHTAVGTFSDDYTFGITHPSTVTVVGLINTFAGGLGSGQFITGFSGSLFSNPDGVVGNADDMLVFGPANGSIGCGAITLCQSLSGSTTLDNGLYYLQVSGTGGANASYGGDITTVAGAVPEASTWAMMLLGFAGIGLLGLRKRRGSFRLA